MTFIMQKIRYCTHTVEPFVYRGAAQDDHRQRPVTAIAFLYGNEKKRYASDTVTLRNRAKKSLSMLSSVLINDDNRSNDFFLPLYDHGHLLGHQYGGSDQSCNLVPMLRKTNRGGGWAKFEEEISRLKQPAIVAMRCTYDDRNDPRIPSKVEAALVPLRKTSAHKLLQGWFSYRRVIQKVVDDRYSLLSLEKRLARQVESELQIDTDKPLRAAFEQDPFLPVDPFLDLSTPAYFYKNLEEAQIEVMKGWRVETELEAKWTQIEPKPTDLPGDSIFMPAYRLPPVDSRPYAALDYMALKGQLEDQLVGGMNKHDIKTSSILDKKTFTIEMRSFAMHVNQYVNARILANQKVYLSDARLHPEQPDQGTAGAGIVLDPEFDHIMPRDPANGEPGPTMFSNLQITSPAYNTRKSNHIWVNSPVTVGWLKKGGPTLRSSSKRSFHKAGLGDTVSTFERINKSIKLEK